MNRRKFIAGAGGIGAVTLGGAALMGSVSAEEQVNTGWFGVPDKHYQESQSGRLKSLTLEDIQILVEWKNFSYAATHFEYTLSASIDGKTREILSENNIDISEEHFGDTDYEGKRQHGAGSVELLDYFDPEDIETPYDYEGSEYTEDVSHTHKVEFTLSVDVHDDGKNTVNGDVTGDGHIHLTNLGAEKTVGGTADFDSEEQQKYDPGEGEPEPDPDTETVSPPAEGIEIETRDHQSHGHQIKIDNDREITVNVVYEWDDGTKEVFTVNGKANSGWRNKGDGDPYEG